MHTIVGLPVLRLSTEQVELVDLASLRGFRAPTLHAYVSPRGPAAGHSEGMPEDFRKGRRLRYLGLGHREVRRDSFDPGMLKVLGQLKTVFEVKQEWVKEQVRAIALES